MSEQTISARAKQMFSVVERYQSSNLTQKAFCITESLSVSTFHYWLAKYRRYHSSVGDGQQPTFVELRVPSNTPLSAGAIVLSYPTGVTVSLTTDFDVSFLKELIAL